MKIYFSAGGSEGITAEKFKQTNKQPTRETKTKQGNKNSSIFVVIITISLIWQSVHPPSLYTYSIHLA